MNRYSGVVVLIIMIICQVRCYAWFGYDRAVYAAQKGNWQKATQLLTQKLVNAPNRADLLYDAGVASFRAGEIDKAHVYFARATEQDAVDTQIKEQAYFNCGNCCVERKQLEEAVSAYEKALEINPNNERTQHNLEIVKKMLEQQKQQQQQQEQQDKQQQQKDRQDKQDQKKDNQEKQQNQQQQEKKQQEQQEQKEKQQQCRRMIQT